MRVLFDEDAPFQLARVPVGHDCTSVIRLGWRGTQNGALLTRAERAGFDVLLTLDADMIPEQNMRSRRIAILVIKPAEQGKEAARALAGKVLIAPADLRPGEIRVVRHDDPD